MQVLNFFCLKKKNLKKVLLSIGSQVIINLIRKELRCFVFLCLTVNVIVIMTFRSSYPPEMFVEKGVLKICSKFKGEYPCLSLISINLIWNFIEIALIKLIWNFIEIALRHECSPVNLLRTCRTPLTNTCYLLHLLLDFHL